MVESENKIYCKCNPAPDGNRPPVADDALPERVYDAEIVEDGIKVSCRECGCSRIIPTDGLLSAHAFLNADALYLE